MSELTSYGPDKVLVGVWTTLCGIPAMAWAYILLRSPTWANAGAFLLTLILPAIPLIFASRFRATFTPSDFVYRRWGPAVRVGYDDIRSIEVTNRTPIAKDAVGAFIVTKNGSRLPFWPKLFPRPAIDRFFALAPTSIPEPERH